MIKTLIVLFALLLSLSLILIPLEISRRETRKQFYGLINNPKELSKVANYDDETIDFLLKYGKRPLDNLTDSVNKDNKRYFSAQLYGRDMLIEVDKTGILSYKLVKIKVTKQDKG